MKRGKKKHIEVACWNISRRNIVFFDDDESRIHTRTNRCVMGMDKGQYQARANKKR